MNAAWVIPVKAETNMRAHALDDSGRTYCGRFSSPINGWQDASDTRPRCRRCVRAVVEAYLRSERVS